MGTGQYLAGDVHELRGLADPDQPADAAARDTPVARIWLNSKGVGRKRPSPRSPDPLGGLSR